jgi:hypothetical protein
VAYTPSVFVKWKYTSDRGVEYVYKILKFITDQNTQEGEGHPKVGGEASEGTELRPADSFKPRVALLYNATNKLARRVICFTASAPLYIGTEGENTLNLYAGRPSESLEFTCYGYEGERMRGERPSA